MFVSQLKGKAKCSWVMPEDSVSKIGMGTCGFISLCFMKIFQLDRIIYQKYFISEFVFFFSGRTCDLFITENEVNVIFKGKIILNYI